MSHIITPSRTVERIEPINPSCAFCESGFITKSIEDLRWAGWRRRGDYWVCPDCAGGAE